MHWRHKNGCYELVCISDLILIFLHQHVKEFKIFKINSAVRGLILFTYCVLVSSLVIRGTESGGFLPNVKNVLPIKVVQIGINIYFISLILYIFYSAQFMESTEDDVNRPKEGCPSIHTNTTLSFLIVLLLFFTGSSIFLH